MIKTARAGLLSSAVLWAALFCCDFVCCVVLASFFYCASGLFIEVTATVINTFNVYKRQACNFNEIGE